MLVASPGAPEISHMHLAASHTFNRSPRAVPDSRQDLVDWSELQQWVCRPLSLDSYLGRQAPMWVVRMQAVVVVCSEGCLLTTRIDSGRRNSDSTTTLELLPFRQQPAGEIRPEAGALISITPSPTPKSYYQCFSLGYSDFRILGPNTSQNP